MLFRWVSVFKVSWGRHYSQQTYHRRMYWRDCLSLVVDELEAEEIKKWHFIVLSDGTFTGKHFGIPIVLACFPLL